MIIMDVFFKFTKPRALKMSLYCCAAAAKLKCNLPERQAGKLDRCFRQVLLAKPNVAHSVQLNTKFSN
jgi:hypothetical protein